MRLNFISSSKAVAENILKSGISEQYDEDLAKMFADDAIDEVVTVTNCKRYIFHGLAYQGKVQLPSNFKTPLQVAYKHSPNPDEVLTRTSISQYIERLNVADEGCQLEININCPKCKKPSCEHTSYPIEVNVKEHMLASNPELSMGYNKFLIGYSNNNNSLRSRMNNNFYIAKPTRNYFHNLPKAIKACQVPNLDNLIEYSIDNKVLTLNSIADDTEVLVSYAGTMMDDDGWLMIPDDPFVLKAVSARINEGFALYDYNIKRNQSARTYWMDMKAVADILVKKAKARIRIPDMDEWDEFLRTIWKKRIPYTQETNRSGKYFPDEYSPETLGYN